MKKLDLVLKRLTFTSNFSTDCFGFSVLQWTAAILMIAFCDLGGYGVNRQW